MISRQILVVLFASALLSACGSTPTAWEGMSPVEAGKLQDMGVTAEEAAVYQEMHFTSSTIQRWHDQGIKIQHNIIAGHDGGFTAEDAGKWHKAGLSLRDAYEWREENFNPEEAMKWRLQGVDLRDAKKMRKKGISPDGEAEAKDSPSY